MSHTEAWFSIIQYVPDLDRAEGVNVGVALFSLGARRVRVALSDSNHAVRMRFAGHVFDDDFLTYAKQSLKLRLERLTFPSLVAFQDVIDREANELVLSPPRATTCDSEYATLVALRRALVDPRPEELDAAERVTLLQTRPIPFTAGHWLLSLQREAA